MDAGRCDGVLLLHGTDTLAYSAAALSFLLLGLPVPVLLTGSMRPAGTPDSDAWANLFGAMQALHQGLEPGVQVFFHGKLMHGARLTKLGAAELDAFAVLPRPRTGPRAPAIAPALAMGNTVVVKPAPQDPLAVTVDWKELRAVRN